jgi:hypothetical protein
MNQESLKKLAGAANAEELRRAIEALCQPFGKLKDIRLLPNKHGGDYLCFVELDSPNLNPSVIEKLGGINYGNSVAFRIPFKPAER